MKNKILMIIISMFLLVVTMTSALSISDPLVFYDFANITGSNVIDSSGNGNDGTISNTPTFYNESGHTFINFSANTGYVTLPVNFLNNITGDYTVALWIKTNANTSGITWTFGDNDWNNFRFQDFGNIKTVVRGATSQAYPTNSNPNYYNDNQNHLVIYGTDGTNGFFNLDNQGQINFTDGGLTGQAIVRLGVRAQLTDYYEGSVAYLSIYERVLSKAEQTAYYNLGNLTNPLLNETIPPVTNNTYSSFIEFEVNDTDTFFDSGGINDLEYVSGNMQVASSPLRGNALSIGSASTFQLSGLSNLSYNNHTINYFVRFNSGITNVNDFVNGCNLVNTGTFTGNYVCDGVTILSLSGSTQDRFISHVFDSDSQREYIYTINYPSGNPVLKHTRTSVNSSIVLNGNDNFLINPLNGAGRFDELSVYGDTLDNESIKSLLDNGINNLLFTQHPAYVAPSPPSSVSLNTPFQNITINSTGVDYNLNHSSASGTSPINYISSFESLIYSIPLSNSLNNYTSVSLDNSMFVVSGFYDVQIISNNSEGFETSTFSNRVFICESVYQETYSTCINDTQIKTYTDLNSCVPVYDFPGDNGSSVVCDDGVSSQAELDERNIEFKENLLNMLWILIIGVALIFLYMMTRSFLFGILTTVFFYLLGIYLFIAFPNDWIIGVGALIIGSAFGLGMIVLNKHE